GKLAAQARHGLDQLRNGGEEQQHEKGAEKGLEYPDMLEADDRSGNLALVVGRVGVVELVVQRHQAEGNEQQHAAQDFQDVLPPQGQPVANQVYADMRLARVGVADDQR